MHIFSVMQLESIGCFAQGIVMGVVTEHNAQSPYEELSLLAHRTPHRPDR